MSMTLEGLFTQIADAIRSKTGSNDPIPAQSMPAAIAAISDDGGSDALFPTNFHTELGHRFLAVSGDNVNFYISLHDFPGIPRLLVIPGVHDVEYGFGGSFVMLWDDSVGYRLFFNGQELTVSEYVDDSDVDYINMQIYFTYDHPLYSTTVDETERAIFWL